MEWLQNLSDAYIISLPDVFTSGKLLIDIIRSFRPDLVDFSPSTNMPTYEEKCMNNQCAFDILKEEYNIPQVHF